MCSSGGRALDFLSSCPGFESPHAHYADVAELADALDLGSSVYDVQVQLLSSAVLLRIDKHNKI